MKNVLILLMGTLVLMGGCQKPTHQISNSAEQGTIDPSWKIAGVCTKEAWIYLKPDGSYTFYNYDESSNVNGKHIGHWMEFAPNVDVANFCKGL
jgi:hypothetical protein